MINTKSIVVCLFFSGIWSALPAQGTTDSLHNIRFTPYIESGIFPYGYKSIHTRSEKPLLENDKEFSRVFGLSISPLPWLAVYGEWHSQQYFRSPYSDVEWIPFDPPEMKGIYTDLTRFNCRSESFNMGIMIGGDVTDNFSVYMRFGAGTTRHYYTFSYNDGQEHTVTSSTAEENRQISFVTSYFPIKFLGFTNSFSVSKNLPFWRMGIIGRIDFKVK